MSEDAKSYRVRPAGDSPDWSRAETQFLSPCAWSPNPPPSVSLQALWQPDALLVRLCSDAPPTRAVNTAPGSPVWQDSCLECFLGGEQGYYVNLEANANSALLAAVGPDRHDRRPLVTLELFAPAVRSAPCGSGWEAVFTVSSGLLEAYFGFSPEPGETLRANFYACGDLTPAPYYAAWSPVRTEAPDFHRPEFFGTLLFCGEE